MSTRNRSAWRSMSLLVWMVMPLGVAAQEAAVTPLSPRWALTVAIVPGPGGEAAATAATSVAVAAGAAIVERVPGVWFRAATGALGSGAVGAVADEMWEAHQAEVLVALTAQPAFDDLAERTRRGEPFQVRAEIIEIRPRDGGEPRVIGRTDLAVLLDPAGRYQRTETWDELVAAVERHRATASPGVTVTISSDSAFVIEGLPEWVVVERSTEGARVQRVVVRGLQRYELTAVRPGHRRETIVLDVERTPVTHEVTFTPYPRHTVALTLRGLSWPGLEYAWYPHSTQWMVRGGVTTFGFGLSALRELGTRQNEASVFTSYDLAEVEAGWQWLFGSRDRDHRLSAGAGIALRIVYGALEPGLDPVIPAVFRPAVSSEWQLPGWSGRFTVSQRISSDLFVTSKELFLPDQRWYRQIAPGWYVQLPIYRLAVRVRL